MLKIDLSTSQSKHLIYITRVMKLTFTEVNLIPGNSVTILNFVVPELRPLWSANSRSEETLCSSHKSHKSTRFNLR